ncbi:bile acid beta-glucosidase [Oculatella sp. LEGE 06141]|uniref:GH116 family glycosyl hydrolase n=1 Tax=Oculatella sp. LEGE 06141 TaxID=1828648 RepID=UPI00187E3D8A|nr:GH116 family glycosyl hydrolase [Oculatella sp. LEGE 06141]MBE9180996.1 bile acid beta-glucosidase [Oculatella sp. LEGE 06141]
MTNLHPFPQIPQIPDCAWTRPLGLGWEHPYTVRYASNLDDGPWHGMPLGGFGAGCIGRSPRGDFNLWHIDGGEHLFQTMPACQFSVFEQVGDRTQSYALSTAAPTDGTLSAWNWYPSSQSAEHPSGQYAALYPRSWFTYESVFQAALTCEQFSPIWAENYQETSYPVAMFVWTAHNPTDRPITLSILLTWHNMVGWFTNALKSPDVQMRDDGSPVYDYQPKLGQSHGNLNRWMADEGAVGCLLDRMNQPDSPQEGDGQWAIATLPSAEPMEVFYHTRWNPAGDGADLWHSFAANGSLPNCADDTAGETEQIGAAIAVRLTLAPGETRQIPFVVAWDLPVTEFAAGIEYYRRYTDFFGRNGRNAWTIAQTALAAYPQWQQEIDRWQQPILQRDDLPDWFKMALFNELYDLTDGGTLWTAASDRDPVGQFAVLECIDYRWYESLDVRLYGAFALLMLWPELEKAVMRAFARAIPASDDRTRVIGYYYTIGADSPQALRKAADATPHDLGAPNEHPWEKTNYTSYQDCNLWKDLASDFVLQVYRDFWLTGATDVLFLQDCWASVVRALHYLKTFDLNQDGLPENSGAPDQTFDDWRLRGISAYCGGLWLAALEAAIAIGNTLLQHGLEDESEPIQHTIHTFQQWLDQARPVYHNTLWNGQYYRLDSDSGSDVVMADQLCGQFYARLLGLPDIVPEDCARSALKTVYEACFLKFHNAQIGAANGLRPDGSPANPKDTHPLEVWTGINFGLAAFLVQMGYQDEALRLTEAVVHQVYENGLQFRTPEAITAVGTFRASHYLRAMAIWAVYREMTVES